MTSPRVLSLYRRILRLHQIKLPDVPRAVGDKYVKKEFRAHQNTSPEQENEFFKQWLDYEAHLATEADIFGLGRDLQEEHVENLTDDQKLQLQKLQESAVSVGEELRSESKEASSQNHQKP